MKKLIIMLGALSLAGCASTAKLQRPMDNIVPPVHYHKAAPVPTAPFLAPKINPASTPTVVPATPVPPGTFKMRWDALKSGAREMPFFHHKHTTN